MGKAIRLKERVSSYFRKNSSLLEKTKILVSLIKKISITIVESEIESLLLEATLIKKHKPKFNSRLIDGKAYPLIRITKKDKYPALLSARRQDDNNSIYFGPYPSSKSMWIVIKSIRKIFPFVSILKHPKRICLYYHLGLCPCPPIYDSIEMENEYKKTIRYIIQFLNGQTKKIIRELEKERNILSKKELYHKAIRIQEKINAILYITTRHHSSIEYELNPNLLIDIRKNELDELYNILKSNHLNLSFPQKIECFDISNISGTNSVGSMVVFINGEKDSSQYRKFKISKFIVGPNDFAMMAEVVKRRIKHHEWKYPNLIIIDGGKGQISSVKQVLMDAGISIPIIGIAKKEEIIITENFKEILLPKSNKALLLVMKIRDEAHRFAITYHKKLRSKFIFS
ncbi:UvrABC system protein C [Candidatus Levyibacteriota bacterium]|nr:UvrABC system protein C [Candidatus Levybacteria bacterium]